MENDHGFAIQQTIDRGYIISGGTRSFGSGGYEVYLIRTNSNGDTVWTKTFGGTGWENGRSIKQTKDGGFVITGESYEIVYLLVTSSNGDVLRSKQFHGDAGNWAKGYSVQQTFDGGYVITGYTDTDGVLRMSILSSRISGKRIL